MVELIAECRMVIGIFIGIGEISDGTAVTAAQEKSGSPLRNWGR